MKLRLLDLFCGAGGAAMGYHRAGFEVVGVDISSQPRFPFEFVQGDACEFAREHGHEFDVVHASPPCQAYSNTWKINGNSHPRLIPQVREIFIDNGRPYVIENVPGSPLFDPITLCGSAFGLHTYRHRLFESNIQLTVPPHQDHLHDTVKMGRPLHEGDWYHAIGNFSGVPYVKRDMEVPWMARDDIRECVPPAYTEYIGHQLKESNATRANEVRSLRSADPQSQR